MSPVESASDGCFVSPTGRGDSEFDTQNAHRQPAGQIADRCCDPNKKRTRTWSSGHKRSYGLGVFSAPASDVGMRINRGEGLVLDGRGERHLVDDVDGEEQLRDARP